VLPVVFIVPDGESPVPETAHIYPVIYNEDETFAVKVT
jgi:hypothetical protein